MKTIRYNVFETNSSMTHSITIMETDMYQEWINDNNLCYDENSLSLISKSERNQLVKNNIIYYRKRFHPELLLNKITDEEIEDELISSYYDYPMTYSEFKDRTNDYEVDTNTFTTKSNDKYTIICYYGHD